MTVHNAHSLPIAYISDGPAGYSLQDVPNTFWCRIEVLYPDTSLLVLLWSHPVPDIHMFGCTRTLQTKAPPGSRIFVTHCDGTATEVPVLSRQRRP